MFLNSVRSVTFKDFAKLVKCLNYFISSKFVKYKDCDNCVKFAMFFSNSLMLEQYISVVMFYFFAVFRVWEV